MSKPTHDILATIGEYTDRNTGEKKKRRLKVGVMFTDDQGYHWGKFDSVPVNWDGTFGIFPVRERDRE